MSYQNFQIELSEKQVEFLALYFQESTEQGASLNSCIEVCVNGWIEEKERRGFKVIEGKMLLDDMPLRTKQPKEKQI